MDTDLSGYSQIITLNTTHIKVRFRLEENIDLSDAYQMSFRFYTERLTLNSTCYNVTLMSSRYGEGPFGTDTGAWSY